MDLPAFLPAHFTIDDSLLIIEKSNNLNDIIEAGMHVHECFDILQPEIRQDADLAELTSHRDRIFVFKTKKKENPEHLRGEFLPSGKKGQWLFFGTLWQPGGEAWINLSDRSSNKPDLVFSSEQMEARMHQMQQTDKDLLREKKRFEALFQFSTIAILVSDSKGRIVLANRIASELFGFSPEEFLTSTVEDLVPSRFRERHVGYRDRFHRNPVNRTMGAGLDLYARKKDGSEFPVEISLGHYQTEDGMYIIAYIIDISRRKEIEQAIRDQQVQMSKVNQEIEQLNAELEAKVEQRTHQLQETLEILQHSRDDLEKALSKEKELSDLKTRFVSMASHEFRTPLSTILSSASLVGKYTLTEEQNKRDKHIQRIRSAVSNLTDILNEFLSIGKLEEGRIHVNPSEFNLKEHAKLVCSEMQSILKPGQKISLHHNGPEMVYLDLSLLRNIIINLVSNALKFSPEGARIDVETKSDENTISISVKDQGIGIPEEDRKHLFERFFRAKNVTNIQGTGLGLHIVSKYVELMQGQIEVFSELEKGTTFTIKFNV